MQAFRNKATGKIEAVYEGCRSTSTKYLNTDNYEEVTSITTQERADFEAWSKQQGPKTAKQTALEELENAATPQAEVTAIRKYLGL